MFKYTGPHSKWKRLGDAVEVCSVGLCEPRLENFVRFAAGRVHKVGSQVF